MEEYIENERFNAAKEKIIGKKHNDKGIGTLSEKTVHGVLKHFFEPDEDCHEVALNGYFADIYNDSGVIEIQTRQLNKLREKLAVFLNYYPVTVVYPMPANKWLSWINPETGETGGRRKSPRHFTIYDSFFELYKIKSYLKNPNLTIKLVLMDVEEYKLLNGWDNSKKRGAWRYDRIPVGIREIVVLEQPEDYMQFVPYELEEGMKATMSIIEAIRPGQSVGIFIGPEGGFEEQEIGQARNAGAVPVTLGRRILRTETAGITTLSILMYHLECAEVQ